MHIDYNLFITYGGVAKKVGKGEVIFREETFPRFFYQVIHGEVKLFTANMEGKELIQGIFKEGESFGEPPLLLGKPYPSTAQATTAGIIIKISRENFLNILKDFPELSTRLMYVFAGRIYKKAVSAQIWVGSTPEDKITQFLEKYKQDAPAIAPHPIPYTRQQIADFTGLRVETVIRTLMRMKQKGKVKITNHKLYY